MADDEQAVEIIAPAEPVPDTPNDVKGWKAKIAASWKAASEGILRVSKDLFDAKAALNAKDRKLWLNLSKQLNDERVISEQVQKKLLVIGGKYHNFKDVIGALPPRYNAIYQLSELTKPQLEKAVQNKKLTPTTEDREIAFLIDSKRGAASQVVSDTNIPLVRVVQTRKRLSPESKAAIIRASKQLRKIEGVDLRLTTEGANLIGEDED